MSRRQSVARRLALQALYQWQLGNQEPTEIEAQFCEIQAPGEDDRAYFSELLRGVVAGVDALDARLAPLLDRPVAQVDPIERAILRIAAYELLERLEVPYRVVINEAVELAKRFGAEQGHRFVNGVLDRLAREVRESELPRDGTRPG